MAHLTSLKFTNLPTKTTNNPTLTRRQRLVDRLEEQKRLVTDPTFIPVTKRWKKNPDGSKSIVDHYRRIKPWWRTDGNGNVLLTVKSGLKVVEFEKGKAAISVGPPEARDSNRYADNRYEGRRIRSVIGARWRLGTTTGFKGKENRLSLFHLERLAPNMSP